jgi:hypothetical protein
MLSYDVFGSAPSGAGPMEYDWIAESTRVLVRASVFDPHPTALDLRSDHHEALQAYRAAGHDLVRAVDASRSIPVGVVAPYEAQPSEAALNALEAQRDEERARAGERVREAEALLATAAYTLADLIARVLDAFESALDGNDTKTCKSRLSELRAEAARLDPAEADRRRPGPDAPMDDETWKALTDDAAGRAALADERVLLVKVGVWSASELRMRHEPMLRKHIDELAVQRQESSRMTVADMLGRQ